MLDEIIVTALHEIARIIGALGILAFLAFLWGVVVFFEERRKQRREKAK
jgi:hypothetical protein